MHFLFFLLLFNYFSFGSTIAIIDTGFDLDHEFLRPKILMNETDEEVIDPQLLKEFSGWNFHDNSHLKTPVIEDRSSLQEILLFRNIRAKAHRDGLSFEEMEWFKKKNVDKTFMRKVRQFKKHTHGTFVAGIALREGENIQIFPIRGLDIKVPIVKSTHNNAKTAEEKFKNQVHNSIERVSLKFAKICHYSSLNKVNIVNASYGITYKNITRKFREKYKELTNSDIKDEILERQVDFYFQELYNKTRQTIKRYPNILFVFSAGNSSLDNDMFHHYPSKIKLPNTITVAAMNGDYLASFSNYGKKFVDIGAPGVAILSLVPKVYSSDGVDIYSPASGTSMAAPYISNLAAQILNTNPALTALEVKTIIVATGDEKDHLKSKLISGSLVNNQRALKAAMLSKDMSLTEAINLSKSNLIQLEDSITFGIGPAVAVESLNETTKPESSQSLDQEKVLLDKSVPPASIPQDEQQKSSDQDHSNYTSEQSQQLSED